MTIIENIPLEIRGMPQWGAWRKFDGKKITFNVSTGRAAKSNDPKTWMPFDPVAAALNRGRYSGPSLFLDNGICGVDLDVCRDPKTGAIASAAMDIILSFNSYSEISQSGCGVKIIFSGVMPTRDGGGKNYRSGKDWSCGPSAVEMYGNRRAFCLTGERLGCVSPNVEQRSEQLAALYGRLYHPAPPRPRTARRYAAGGNIIERASKYLAKLPASVSGCGGHNALLHAACSLARFGITGADAMNLLEDFNRRCDPPWEIRDLQRKVNEAAKLVGNDIGKMTKESREVAYA